MTFVYKVRWQREFRSLSIYLSTTFIIIYILLACIRYVSLRFDFAKTFEHMPFPIFLLGLLLIPLLCIAFAFILAQLFRDAAITLTEDAIQGRNFWGRKHTIPLADITTLTRFRDNGINAIVVHSRQHGQIYISNKIERLSELLKALEPYLSHQPQGA